jgi:SAM-dependent methyltransferase
MTSNDKGLAETPLTVPPGSPRTTRGGSREDRWCRPGALDNPIRRWFAPPSRDLNRVDIRPGQVVADLGTGVGFYLPEILRRIGRTGRVYAVDPDPENLEISRRRTGNDPRVTYLLTGADDLSGIPEGSVDRALLILSLCCLVDKRGTLSETWRILRPGGQALVVYPRVSRRRGLGVSRAVWEVLVSEHPWQVHPAGHSLGVRRWRLMRSAPGGLRGNLPEGYSPTRGPSRDPTAGGARLDQARRGGPEGINLSP